MVFRSYHTDHVRRHSHLPKHIIYKPVSKECNKKSSFDLYEFLRSFIVINEYFSSSSHFVNFAYILSIGFVDDF